jgi:hypothetical protein
VNLYVSERQEHQRKMLSSGKVYRAWQPSNAGEFAYAGWRTLKDGSNAVLLRHGQAIFVKAATDALVQELKQLPRGRSCR